MKLCLKYYWMWCGADTDATEWRPSNGVLSDRRSWTWYDVKIFLVSITPWYHVTWLFRDTYGMCDFFISPVFCYSHASNNCHCRSSVCSLIGWKACLQNDVWGSFGHLACSAPEEDHHRVIAAALRPPTDWRRPIGCPWTTWLRTIDQDVQPQNFGVRIAWRKARDRDTWQQVVSTATLC